MRNVSIFVLAVLFVCGIGCRSTDRHCTIRSNIFEGDLRSIHSDHIFETDPCDLKSQIEVQLEFTF